MRSFRYDPTTSKPLAIDGEGLTIEDVVSVARFGRRVEIAATAKERIERCRIMVEVLLEQGEKVYGLTTGFGKLRDIAIAPDDTAQLQVNLIRSHSCGVGDPFAEDVVRAAILLRANTLCRGHSGVRVLVVEELLNMLNDGIYPYIPEKGSLGASGDLAPLSHLGLVLIGDPDGQFYPREKRTGDLVRRCVSEDFEDMPPADDLEAVAEREGWTFRPVTLAAKEGLAINNGTQFMTAVACLAVYDAFFTLRFAELAGAMSLEAGYGVRGAYDPRIHGVRDHAYQAESAARIIGYCEATQIIGLYFNSARLNRAASHFNDVLEQLDRLEREIEDAARLAAFPKLRQAIRLLHENMDRLANGVATGSIDGGDIKHVAARSPRDQIGFFKQLMLPLRREAIDILRAFEAEDLPEIAVSRKARTSLVAALDQLNEVVPDAPIIQDDYSFRCYPQVLACGYRALWDVCLTVEVEINSATDNPLLFPPQPADGPLPTKEAYREWLRAHLADASEGVIGGGNFHGEPIAIMMDYFTIAMAEIANISERRINHLVDESHSRGLPPFLVESSGLNSGFMIPQYTAAALVSENKVLAHPASVDSIPSCANTEDHVSMGTIAARKCAEVLDNVRQVIAVEILAAYQGLEFRRPLSPGRPICRAVDVLAAAGITRSHDDSVLYRGMQRVKSLMSEKTLLDCLMD
ncbi:MAG: aromatic amino acid lyase [Candidatus Lernaella stagnicola]|nr:aromatic amino acid lyase [Candidatus Lernaella stagnicola]